MQAKIIRWIGIVSLGMSVLVASFVAIQWIITLPLWSKIDSGWAQAIGAFVAIVSAMYVTRLGFRHTEKLRLEDKAELEHAMAEIAYQLANDSFRAVQSILRKFESSFNGTDHPKIGTDRLDDLQQSLNTFATKNIAPAIYSEILILKREVAYTLTAVNEHNRGLLVTKLRITKAKNRLRPILESALRL